MILKKLYPVFLIFILSIILSSCSNFRVTHTKRTGIEEKLLSTSINRALNVPLLSSIDKKKVFLETSNFSTYDTTDKMITGYAIGYVKAYLGESGAIIVNDKINADIIIEMYAGALGTDYRDFLIGIPELGVPIPFSGTLETPKLSIIEKLTQTAVCRLMFVIKDNKTDEIIATKTNMEGTSYFNRWTIFFIPYQSTDINDKPTLEEEKSFISSLNDKINKI